jgi:hypothetical protein
MFYPTPAAGVWKITLPEKAATSTINIRREDGLMSSYFTQFKRRNTMNNVAGLGICEDKLSAMKEADLGVFAWDDKTQDSIIDLGMAFALNKRLLYIGKAPLTERKYSQNKVLEWSIRRTQ